MIIRIALRTLLYSSCNNTNMWRCHNGSCWPYVRVVDVAVLIIADTQPCDYAVRMWASASTRPMPVASASTSISADAGSVVIATKSSLSERRTQRYHSNTVGACIMHSGHHQWTDGAKHRDSIKTQINADTNTPTQDRPGADERQLEQADRRHLQPAAASAPGPEPTRQLVLSSKPAKRRIAKASPG